RLPRRVAPGIVHENAAHGLSRGGEEVAACESPAAMAFRIWVTSLTTPETNRLAGGRQEAADAHWLRDVTPRPRRCRPGSPRRPGNCALEMGRSSPARSCPCPAR